MCTVVFLPQSDGGYVLGHNRDERRSRAKALPPVMTQAGGLRRWLPVDPDGGGSWVAVNECGVSACVLNAFDAPERKLPIAPPSRGFLVPEALAHRRAGDAIDALIRDRVRLEEVRAFRLVMAERGEPGSPPALACLAWDGASLRVSRHAGPTLFVSSILDPEGAARAREASWARLVASRGVPDRKRLVRWLASHEPERGPQSVCMHREDAATVARAVVDVGPDRIVLDYLAGNPCAPDAPEQRYEL